MAAMLKDPVNWRYPVTEPTRSGHLQVSDLHALYYEESGNPQGKPVVFIHGGPGSGTDAWQRGFFNPALYRIVLFDQRGAGKSRPHAALEQNTTWDLVADIEKLRTHLGIERWQVFGGSWGSTLALAYAETHPERVTELVLRGIFLGRKRELNWLYQFGASEIFPDAWQTFVGLIPPAERDDMVRAYHTRLTSSDAETRLAAAKVWSGWEGKVSKLMPDATFVAHYEEGEFALAFARIEAHYFINRCFMPEDDHLLRNVGRIRHIPAVIVHGRYDICCSISNAFDLHRAWPEAELIVVPDAGHSAAEPGNSRALVAATERFAERSGPHAPSTTT